MAFFGSSSRENSQRGREMLPMGNAMSNLQPGQYLNQIPNLARGELQPYINAGIRGQTSNLPDRLFGQILQGQQAAPDLYANMPNVYENAPNPYANRENLYLNNAPRQFGEMANDPSAFIDQIMRRYTPSEGYRFKEGRMQGAARNSAASGGFAGTQYDQERQADLIRGLLGQDQQQYLENTLGVQGQGLSGLERMLAGREREGQEYRAGNQEFNKFKYGGAERAQERRLQGSERALDRRLGGEERALTNFANYMANLNRGREERGYNASGDLVNINGTNLGQLESLSSAERRQLMQQLAEQRQSEQNEENARRQSRENEEYSRRQSRENKQRSRSNLIGQLAGGGLGALLGGGAGAGTGSKIGGMLGGLF